MFDSIHEYTILIWNSKFTFVFDSRQEQKVDGVRIKNKLTLLRRRQGVLLLVYFFFLFLLCDVVGEIYQFVGTHVCAYNQSKLLITRQNVKGKKMKKTTGYPKRHRKKLGFKNTKFNVTKNSFWLFMNVHIFKCSKKI